MTVLVKNLGTGGSETRDSVDAELTVERDSNMIFVASAAEECKIILEEGARLTFVLFAVEGWMSQVDAAGAAVVPKLTFEFVGRNSELQFLGLIVGTGESKFAFETISHHVTTNTKASYRVRAAMFDRSAVDYKGNLIITKPAQMTDTYLSHDTLLLLDFARARTVPALEIEADDVKAGHAATIGKVDDELMFYLLSRGIEAKEAEQMLINSFFESQLALIPDEEISDGLRKSILKALPVANKF